MATLVGRLCRRTSPRGIHLPPPEELLTTLGWKILRSTPVSGDSSPAIGSILASASGVSVRVILGEDQVLFCSYETPGAALIVTIPGPPLLTPTLALEVIAERGHTPAPGFPELMD